MASIAYEPIPAEGATTTAGQETTRLSQPLLGTEAGEAVAAADSEEKNAPSADVRGMEDGDRSFKVGERVMRRDGDDKWRPGYVTQVDPLRVTASRDDPSAQGFRWDEVRKIDVDQVVSCFFGVVSNIFGNILIYRHKLMYHQQLTFRL